MHGKRILVLDWETSSLPDIFPWQAEAFPVSLCMMDETGWEKTWIFNHEEERVGRPHLDMIKEIQEEVDSSHRLVAHNMKFDLNWLTEMGIKTDKVLLWCTLLVEYLIEGQKKLPYNLDIVGERRGYKAHKDKVKTFWKAGYNTNEIPLSILLPYGRKDTVKCLRIYQKQVKDVNSLNLSALVSMETEKLRVLSDIEMNGMKVDVGKGQQFAESLMDMLIDIDIEIKHLAGGDFNISSNDHLSAILYGGKICTDATEVVKKKLKSGEEKEYVRKCVKEEDFRGLGFTPLPGTETKKKGYFQVNKGVLVGLKCKTKAQKHFISLLTSRSENQKALETFRGKDNTKGLLNKVQQDGCIHPKFNQTITRTGRLSSSDPNGQNLPRGKTSSIKQIFVPKYDKIGNIDLDQIEWRVAGVLSQDPVILGEIAKGVDYHLDNALRFFGDKKYRTDAKIFGFRLLYGGVAYGMFMDSTMPNFTLKKWESICRQYYEKYTVLKEWQNSNVNDVNRTGQLILPSGRILTFDKHMNKDGTMAYSRREILNYPVQSFATADIMGLTMNIISARMKAESLKSEIICQVHDSLVFDLFSDEVAAVGYISLEVCERLPEYMKRVWDYNFNVSLSGCFETGPNYGSLRQYATNSKEI